MENLDNQTLCNGYVPTASEFHEASGGFWYVFVVCGTIACLVLYGLYIEQVIFISKNAHHDYRRYINWISSIYPFMALMSVIAFSLPRAGPICNAAKTLYMMIGISNFIDLTVLMYGSEEVLLWTLRDSQYSLDHPPLLCCCGCLPKAPVTKIKTRLVLFGCYQLPFSQALYWLIILIISSEDRVVIGSANNKGILVWFNLFIMLMVLLGIYCINIIAYASKNHLKEYNYKRKAQVLKVLIFTITFQKTLFDVLAFYGVFPCKPPIGHYVYKDAIESAVCIVEMALFGFYTYYLYHNKEFMDPNPTTVPGHARRLLREERQHYNTIGNHNTTTNQFFNRNFTYHGDIGDDQFEFEEEGSNNSSLRNQFDFSGGVLVLSPQDQEINHNKSIYQKLKEHLEGRYKNEVN